MSLGAGLLRTEATAIQLFFLTSLNLSQRLSPKAIKSKMSDNYVIHFDEEGTEGYLFVRSLGRGLDGEAILLRSVATSKLSVRKMALLTDPEDGSATLEPWLPSSEVQLMRGLKSTGIVPQLLGVEGSDIYPISMTMEYCNGGTVFDYYTKTLRNQSRQEREGFLWILLAECMRIFTYLQTGYTYVKPTRDCWVKRLQLGKWEAPSPEDTPWHSIHHNDTHMNNIFLSWSKESGAVPRVVLGDWSRADYAATFSFPGIRPELVEVTYFFKALQASLHPRPTLSIERMTADVVSRMLDGKTMLDIVRTGLYEQCLYNFEKLKVLLPKPMTVPGGGKAKVFDLSPRPAWSGANHVQDMHSLLEALKIGAPYKLMRVHKEDICELGNVDMARAVEVSKEEIRQVTGGSSKAVEKAHCRNEVFVTVN